MVRLVCRHPGEGQGLPLVRRPRQRRWSMVVAPMTPSKRPTKKPKPITDHPHAGELEWVVAFRTAPVPLDARESLKAAIRIHLGSYRVDLTAVLNDVSVAVRVIGAGGEASEMEGEGP